MHLNDSFGQSKTIKNVYCHHEQGCAIAAEGYSRVRGELAVVNVTTGPGGLNTLNGVFGQWTDSVPVLYISGQVRYDTTVESLKGRLPIRQMGDQEVDIISVVRPLTKFAEMIKDPKDVRWIIEKAIHMAITGRPGPVWVDVPHNIQSAQIDESTLMAYDGSEKEYQKPSTLNIDARTVLEMLSGAERPIIVCGHGVRISKTMADVKELSSGLGIPVVTTINGFDIISDDFGTYSGRIGTVGQRAGNFALQNADLVLFLGTRNNIRQISYTWKYFARAAKKIAVDIDYAELRKPTLTYDLAIHADLADLMPHLLQGSKDMKFPDWKRWNAWCQERRVRFPVVTREQAEKDPVNPYHFTHELTKHLRDDVIIVTGNGTVSLGLFQSGIVKEGQRMILNSGCASMGYDVPAAVGAACYSGRDVICLTGDGSFQMNIQELATIANYHLPIKMFYFDNGGYASIRQTQDNFFGRRYGIDHSTGLTFPDTAKLAEAYGIPHRMIKDLRSMDRIIDEVLDIAGPVLCHVHMDPNHIFEPKLSSEKKADGRLVSKPLEDMYPFLSRKEFLENMIIPPAKED